MNRLLVEVARDCIVKGARSHVERLFCLLV